MDEVLYVPAALALCQRPSVPGIRSTFGTGTISLDVQFLPDVDIPCPDCGGLRYGREATVIKRLSKSGAAYSLPELMDMSIDEALEACSDLPLVARKISDDVTKIEKYRKYHEFYGV